MHDRISICPTRKQSKMVLNSILDRSSGNAVLFLWQIPEEIKSIKIITGLKHTGVIKLAYLLHGAMSSMIFH